MVNFGAIQIALCCIVVLVSIHPSNGMDEEAYENVFQKSASKSFREGRIRYDETHTPVAFYGAGIVLEGDTVEEKANNFIEFHSSILEVDFGTSSSSLQYKSHNKRNRWTSINLMQVVGTLPVFDARVIITIDEENKVQMITSSYRKGVTLNTYKKTSYMSIDDVRDEIAATYLTGKVKSFRLFNAQFGVFPKKKKTSPLAWKVVFGASGEIEEYSVIINDSTQEILEMKDITLDKKGREREVQIRKWNNSYVSHRASTSSNSDEDLRKHSKSVNLRSRRKEKEESVVNNSFFGRTLQGSFLRDILLIIIRALEDVLSLVKNPSNMPTISPGGTDVPTKAPVSGVTDSPTKAPVPGATDSPSKAPAPGATDSPSKAPVLEGTDAPTALLSNEPSGNPTVSAQPSRKQFFARGNVFDPDPISSGKGTYGVGGFKDDNDSDSADLTAQLVEKNLKDLKFDDNKYHLNGPWAQIVDIGLPATGLFSQESKDFKFTREQQGFEAVNCYYHVDNIMRYINNDLDIEVKPYQYNGGAKFDPHGANGDDNSFFSSSTGHIEMGEGGVDDAEDPDVIIHELGHALHDWLTSGGLSQVNGLSEGFGDYVAMSYSRSKKLYESTDDQYHWVFKWDGHNEYWGGRMTNYGAKYPGGLVGQVHTDGQIWSTCNMKIYDAIGREKSDKAHFMGISSTSSNSNQEDVANAILQAARTLKFSEEDITKMKDIYISCGYDVSNDVCGDGILGSSEECEAFNVGDASCADFGCGGGEPICTENCKLDYSSCNPSDDQIVFELALKTDGYPDETSWTLSDGQNNVVLENESYSSNTMYKVQQCVKNDCYIFKIFDSAGDGMCCEYGQGSYALRFDREDEDTNPSFGSMATHTYCPEGSDEGTCGNGEIDVGEQCDTTAFGDFTCQSMTGCGGGNLSCNECEIDSSSCAPSAQQGKFLLEIKFDDYSAETKWDIKDKDGKLLFEGNNYYDVADGISESFCLDKSDCYVFTIYDTAGDGICCDYGSGSYSIEYDNVDIPVTGFNFGRSASHEFGTCG